MNSTLQPFIKKVTDVINVFTQWIEQHQGLVTAFAVAVAGAATLGIALVAIGVIAKGVSAGLAVLQTVTKGFAFVQGVCIAQATAMKSSILLIGQAFANYRNLAIPAMVGTEKFCMALGLASTAANRARASIILMSNAEAAAAAKSFLAAKWQAMTSALSAFRNSALAAAIATKAQGAAELALGARSAVVNGWLAMTNALKGMTVASVSATVALKAQAVVEGAMNAGRSIASSWVAMTAALKGMTLAGVGTVIALKAQAAAEAVCTVSTAALNAVRSAGIAIVTAFTAVNLKSVIAIGAVTAGNFLLATAAKVAAGAMLALSAVMSFIAAHPVAIALIALTAILGGVCIALYKAGNYTAKLSDEASRLREKGDELRRTDQVRMERLQQLAQKQKLTNAEMAEARILAGKLQKKYGDLGISVTDNAMRIKALSEAVSTLDALELKVHDDGELQKIQRLKELSLKVNLSVDEQNEASSLIESLSLHFGDLGLEVDRAKKKVIALSDSAKRLGGVKLGVQLAMEDLPKFDKLKTLSMELELTVPQQDEAQRLIAELSAKYGELGVHVNRTTGQIEKLNTVAGSITDLRFRIRGQEDILKLFRLQDLSFQGQLTISGQEEAKSLLDDLSSKYGELGLSVDAASGRIVALTTAQLRFAQAHERIKGGSDPMKEVHLSQLERLKKLASQEKLTADEQREAQNILTSLNGAYNHLGLGIDSICGKLNVATDAQKKFNNAMKESALAQLDAEIAEYKSNIQELQRENESLDSHRNHNLVSQLSGRQDETLRKQAANLDRILVLRQKIAVTQKRRKAGQAEKKEAYTGEKAPAKTTTEEKVRQERTRSSKDQELVANAESRVKEIEKRLKRERQTDLENEIEDIIALRDEYKKLIQTMLTFEKSKKNSDKQKIADLEKKLAQADKTAEERIAKAKEKEAQKLQKDVSSYKERFAETVKSVRERRAEEKTDREVDTQLETDPDAGAERLKQLIAQYQKAAQNAKLQFQLELTSATKDGTIDDTERGKIDAAMQAYSRAESMVDKYSAKLNSAQKGTQEASEDVENTRQIGSFLAASLDSMLGGSSDSTRTANATEMVAKYSKETNRLLKKMNMQNSTSSLTYT
jgi:hypothetical protein